MENYNTHREMVLNCARKISQMGYVQGTGGNVSVKIDNTGMLAITPSNMEYDLLTVDDICVMDFNLSSVVDNGRKASIETGMHSAIYKNRPDVSAVVHTHQIYASVFAVINEPIPPLFDEAASYIGNTIEVIPYSLSGTPDLADKVGAGVVSGNNCYILKNHGALSLGGTLDEAVRNSVLLEKTAQVYYMALSTGRGISVLPQETQDLMHKLLVGRQKK